MLLSRNNDGAREASPSTRGCARRDPSLHSSGDL